jgi:hypothetical protein
VTDIAKNGNDAAVPTLAKGPYNADSNVGDFLVDKWRITLPFYAQSSAEPGVKAGAFCPDDGAHSWRAPREIGADQINLAETRLSDALNSKSTAVRIAAIRSNVEAGSIKGRDTIKRLATKDTAKTKAGKQTHFPVREKATKAIPKLQR